MSCLFYNKQKQRKSLTDLFLVQTALATLGIPFADVLRILVAILLLGNVKFVDGEGVELDVKGNNGRSFGNLYFCSFWFKVY